MDPSSDIALVGLAVMGQNLVLNMADHGFRVAVYNRTASVTDAFLAGEAKGRPIVGAKSLAELVGLLTRPRRVVLLVKAGAAVDALLGDLAGLLEPGDVVIDGGNSLFTDSERRTKTLGERGIHFVGAGVSGGEEGARHGPSIMPGGDPAAWPLVKDVLQAVAAKVEDGTPCCDWVGPGGAGHFVKMVHNGIEYGDMQVLAEAYHLLRASGLSHDDLSATFRRFNDGVLSSFLVEITAEVLAFKDEDGGPLVERILDAAGQKGTGKWTVSAALDLGQPLSLVAEAVIARVVSSLKDERTAASKVLSGPDAAKVLSSLSRTPERARFVSDVHDALYASKIVSYAQGFMLLGAASQEHGWDLDLGRIASLWREGCIIRARFLDDITSAFRNDPRLPSLLLDRFFKQAVNQAQQGWRRVVATACEAGIPVPAYSSALAFYDAYRCDRLPANLLQAQRDYFGAHTYERVDRPRGEFFHTNWTGRGGSTTAGSYEA